MENTTNLAELENGAPFTWGELVKIHKFFSYAIVQYHPLVESKKGSCVFDWIDTRKYNYHIYVDELDTCHSFTTIDAAIAACIAYRHEGANHHADIYFIKAIS